MIEELIKIEIIGKLIKIKMIENLIKTDCIVSQLIAQSVRKSGWDGRVHITA